MNQETPVTQQTEEQTERVPIMQRIIDNPFLLLFIGVVFPYRVLCSLGNHGTREHTHR